MQISSVYSLPNTIPIDKMSINGRLLPSDDRHLSDIVPINGDTKNATNGEIPQTIVIFECSTPISNKSGDTNAVSAAYANSIAITTADNRTKSKRDFSLKKVKIFLSH